MGSICKDARRLGFNKSTFLWELNSKVFILNIQVDMATIKGLVMLSKIKEMHRGWIMNG